MADKVTLQKARERDQIKHGKLLRELNIIEQVERSDMRMLETDRHRLRSKLKRLELPRSSYGSDARDVRMSETHNPGFCYHRTGAIRARDRSASPRKSFVDVFDVVHPMIFTDGEVDPDKIICLHVLAAHYAKSGPSETSGIRPITPLVEKGKREYFSGAWNSVLPCYVLDIQGNVDDVTNFSDEIKRHGDPLVMESEEEIVRDFEWKYKKYLQENSDVGLALSTNRKRTKMVPNGIGKITIIPPHVYSMLGAAQELKIKQAIAEESRRKKFRRSNSSIKNVDDQSISFRLDADEDDVISRRLMNATSIRGWNGSRIIGASKISYFQNRSRRSATSSRKMEPSVTTLKRASPRSSDLPSFSEDVQTDTQIVTIKSSSRAMGRMASKTSSTKSPFRNFSSTHDPGSLCSNSIMSGVSLGEPRKILRPIFINYPVESLDLKNKKYKIVAILVNNQIQALVHSVLDVLERVNPSKMRKIVSTASSPYEIRRMLIRPDIQSFIDFLAGQPLISSPNSFVISMASILDEIDPNVEGSIEKELVATTLAVPPALGLHRLVEEIRDNLFVDPEQPIGSKARIKIETFDRQKRKLLDSRPPCKELAYGKDVFDVNTSCQHSDIQETRMTCACCYAKWKESLPDTERSKVPDFSFLISHEIEMIPENAAKNETLACETNSTSIGNEEERKGQDSSKIKKSPDASSSIVKNTKLKAMGESVMIQPTEINLSVTKIEHSLSSRRKLSERRPIGSKTSNRLLSTKTVQQPETSLHAVDRKSRPIPKTPNKLFEKSMRSREKTPRQKLNVDKIDEARSCQGSTNISGLTADCQSRNSANPQQQCFKITLGDDAPSPKSQFKPWKASQNPDYLDPDRIILRRMTNPQRILVGQMCASLKTRKINMEGFVRERTPLAALITPVLSHEALRILTKGTRQAMSRKREKTEEQDDCITIVSEKLTSPVLAKVYIGASLFKLKIDTRVGTLLKQQLIAKVHEVESVV